ncbi:MAG TPA: GspH/FimT family pseudopilin [Steroidobacteraceae bacterium]|nr:GspH/FimT family pseudopilin [Steroidobacteraceae bacterium]
MLRPKMKDKQGGFTLIELMFTITVLAVLLAIGVPSFREFTQASRMATATNNLIADLNYARTEAIKRRQPVTLCRSTDGTNCATAAGAFREWIVFLDSYEAAGLPGPPPVPATPRGNGVVDDDELVLRASSIDERITPVVNGRRMVFEPSGFPDMDIAETVTQLVLCDARGNVASAGEDSAARAITISTVGRPTLTRARSTITTLGGCP